MSEKCLGIFAKYWQPGQVKTRLAATIGEQRSAQVYQWFLETLLDRLTHCGDRHILVYSPPERVADFEQIAPAQWQIAPQAEGNLGQRMQAFFQQQHESGCQRVVLVGSDSPNLPLEYVRQAFELLNDHPVVLGPTEDGGYWLIGTSGRVQPIFENIPWSTPQVWPATLAALDAAQLSHATLPTWYDVDVAEDLDRLIDELQKDCHKDQALIRLLKKLDEK